MSQSSVLLVDDSLTLTSLPTVNIILLRQLYSTSMIISLTL